MGILDFFRRNQPREIALPSTLYYYDGSGALQPVRARSPLAQWNGYARSSFTTNLLNALHSDMTNASDRTLSVAYIQSVTAAACIEINAQFMQQVPVAVIGADGEPLENERGKLAHPLGNFTDNATRLLWDISVHQDIWGRAYLRKRRSQHGNFSILEALWPPDVTEEIRTDTNGEDHIVAFRVGREVIPRHQVVYLPRFDPNDRLGGLSPMEFVLAQIGVSRGMTVFAANFFFNGAVLSGILEVADITEDQRKLLSREFNAQFSGSRKAHRVFVINQGTKYTPTGAPPEDLAMSDLSQIVNTEIVRAFGVHPALVGLSQVGDPLSAQSTFKAIEANQIRGHTLPRAEKNLDELNRQWAWVDFEPRKVYTLQADPSKVEALSPVTDENVAQTTTLENAGLLTLNEGRERMGGAPYPGDNGDVVFVSGVLYPAASLMEVAQLNIEVLRSQSEAAPASPFAFSQTVNGAAPAPQIIEASPPPPQLPERAASAQLRELANWERKVARSTPDCVFEPDELRGHPVAAFVRERLDCRDDPGAVFWVARAWLETGQEPPLVRDVQFNPNEPQPVEATPEEYETFWGHFDELRADLGADWLAWMGRLAKDGRLTDLIDQAKAQRENPDNNIDFGLFFQVDDKLLSAWLGTVEEPGPLTALLFGGMAAGNDAVINNVPADYRSKLFLAPEHTYTPVMREAIWRQAGLSLDWSLLSEEAYEFARAYLYDLIGGINRETTRKLQRVIAEWLESGAAISDLAESLEPIFRDTTRAELIAQTEAIRAYNEGARKRYRDVGVQEARWKTVNVGIARLKKQPGDVCNICAPLHNQIGSIETGWVHPGGKGAQNKYKGNVYRQPAHPRCRCFSQPILTAEVLASPETISGILSYD